MTSKYMVALLGVAVAAAPGLVSACNGCGCGTKPPAASVKATPKKDHHHAAISKVTTEELAKSVDSGEKVVLLDARSEKYDDGKRISSAQSLLPDASEQEILAALPDKNAKIVAYCSNKKCPASEKLAHRLVGMGYVNVSKYPEGIKGWIDAGKPVN